jgi:hypothetical protein
VLGQEKERKGRGSRLALIAVNQKRGTAVIVFSCEEQEVDEDLDLEQRDRRIDEVEIKVV